MPVGRCRVGWLVGSEKGLCQQALIFCSACLKGFPKFKMGPRAWCDSTVCECERQAASLERPRQQILLDAG
jgi:hypothetical protein